MYYEKNEKDKYIKIGRNGTGTKKNCDAPD